MVVICNHRLGAHVELLVSDTVARAMLEGTAAAARPLAAARWELELVRWLEARARRIGSALDVSEIAWTREHYEAQRDFLVEAIARAAVLSEHAAAFSQWKRMVEGHPRDSGQFGRRWQWDATALNHNES
jgi:hypothetical protein